jgi:excisionase family DNA binding protein
MPDRAGLATPEVARGLTVREAARYLRVGPDRLRAMVRRGELKAVNVGTVRRPRLVVLLHHLAEFEQRHSAAEPPKPPRRRRRPATVDYYP